MAWRTAWLPREPVRWPMLLLLRLGSGGDHCSLLAAAAMTGGDC